MCGGDISPPLVVNPSFCVGVRLLGVVNPSYFGSSSTQLSPNPPLMRQVGVHEACWGSRSKMLWLKVEDEDGAADLAEGRLHRTFGTDTSRTP